MPDEIRAIDRLILSKAPERTLRRVAGHEPTPAKQPSVIVATDG
jgi:hypothetical protein